MFRKITETPLSTERLIPVDDMSINGQSITEQVEGYRQLSIGGRGLVGQIINTTNVPLRDGTFFNYLQLEPRILNVRYRLQAPSSAELRQRFEQLSKLLKGILEIKFKDEPNWTYYGCLQSTGDLDETRLAIVSDFEIYCPSPYKYGAVQSGQTVVLSDNQTEVLPESISVRINSYSQTLTLRNAGTGQELVFDHSFSAGDTFKLTWKEQEVTAFKNGAQNMLPSLKRMSVPETFIFRNGDRLVVEGGVGELMWRDKSR